MTTKINALTSVLVDTERRIYVVREQTRPNDEKADDAEEPFDDKKFWERLNYESDLVSNEATKMCMAFGSDPLPEANDWRTFCTSLETACSAIMFTFCRFPKQKGLTLRRTVQSVVEDILDRVLELIKGLQINLCHRDRRHLQLTGCTWESCERIKTLPRDNKSAVSSVIKGHLELVNDACCELQEAIDNEALDDGDDEDDDEKWCNSERDVAKDSRGLLKVVQSCLKKAVETVETSNVSPSVNLDQVAIAADAVSPATDDFVSVLYPPVNNTAIIRTVNALADCLKSLLTALSESGSFTGEPPPWVAFLCTAIAHNQNKVTERIRLRQIE